MFYEGVNAKVFRRSIVFAIAVVVHYNYRDGDTAPENFGIYSFIAHDRFNFFTSKGRIRAVMYMTCVKCSCSELKLAKHLHTFFVMT